ncbi:dihydrodipicolinate synthase family protein [Rhizobium sp. 0TCS1.26]|uniref:dihydrodipicolinate synthase family protein n=1 Tax=Rhizobium sp. 0TCS1.26 TaxID=3142623 RepID=UPI003D2DC546
MSPFHGLSAFPLTPASSDGDIDVGRFGAMISRIAAAGVGSIGVLGSTGGYAYLTREARLRAVEVAVHHAGHAVPVIAGVGALRTEWAVDLARDAAKAGADGLLLAPMSYLPLTEDEVFAGFLAVAEATDLPLCIYNNPTTTRFAFSDHLITRLAEVKTIVSVKMPLPANLDFSGELQRLRGFVPADFSIGYSGDWGAADSLLAGGDAWFSVVAGLLPDQALRLTRAAMSGNIEKARRLDDAFQPLWTLFRTFGSFRVMYMIGDILGLEPGSPPRPILPLPAAQRPQVEAAVATVLDL